MLKTALLMSVLAATALLLSGCGHWGHWGGHGQGHHYSASDTHPYSPVNSF